MPLWMLWMCPREEIVDTIERMLPLRVGVKKHRRTVEEKRAIIEEPWRSVHRWAGLHGNMT